MGKYQGKVEKEFTIKLDSAGENSDSDYDNNEINFLKTGDISNKVILFSLSILALSVIFILISKKIRNDSIKSTETID